MLSYFQAHAARHGLTPALAQGAGLGVALAAVYLSVGLARSQVQEPARIEIPVEAVAPSHDHARLLAAYNAQPAFGQQLQAPAAPVVQKALARGEGDIDCLTKAVYFEARGETAKGQAAVAQVVLNRVRHPAFPKSVCGVVFQGCQFSFACDGSLRRAHEPGAWRRAHKIAARALAGAVVAEVGGATHFHAAAVNPAWGPGLSRVSQVGLHVFYRLNRNGARVQAARPAPAPEPAQTDVVPPEATLVRLDDPHVESVRIARPAEAAATDAAAAAPENAAQPAI